MLNSEEIIRKFNLVPHPEEGGYFVETYRSSKKFTSNLDANGDICERNYSTAIYYFFTEYAFSKMHCLTSDEVFHFYYGDTVEMLHLYEDGSGKIIYFGNDIANGCVPQVVVPKGVWQGARLKPGGSMALIGCTVSPGFDYSDYEHGNYADLSAKFPLYKPLLKLLTD